ncbi:hypothetical protein GCM10022420_068990 [Streptomyces iranensis]|uniref:Uncharacterized protein n=1 Tax=Streptomyces iranensis TaxID=576784 RepID=A0ABS4N9I2_9ACTN|nr:hypothetical protein [Streptomyces iranensis]
MATSPDDPGPGPGWVTRSAWDSGSSAQVARLAPVSELRVRRALRGARRLGGRGGHTGWSPERTHFTDHAKHFQQ